MFKTFVIFIIFIVLYLRSAFRLPFSVITPNYRFSPYTEEYYIKEKSRRSPVSIKPLTCIVRNVRDIQVDFKWAFGPNRLNLQLLGLWRSGSDHRTYRILCDVRFSLILVTAILSGLLPSIVALKKVWGNLNFVTENLQYTLPFSAAVIKFVVVWSKREVLAILNDMVLSDWSKVKSDEERNVMRRWARISRIITIIGNALTYTVLILSISLYWFGISVKLETGVKGIDTRFILHTYFSYDLTKTKNFAIIYFMHTFSVAMGSICYTAVDGYLIVLVFHICGQLHNLNGRILNLNGYQNFRYQLAFCVQEHIRLLRFIKIIDNSFTMMLLILLIYFGFLFCFYGFFIATQIGANDLPFGRIIFIASTMAVTFSHMCLFCVIGEILLMKSDAIFYSTYNCEWYTLKPQDAKCLIYLMIRASRPTYITAGKLFPMTMATFSSLLKTSGGYISVLLANQNSNND